MTNASTERRTSTVRLKNKEQERIDKLINKCSEIEDSKKEEKQLLHKSGKLILKGFEKMEKIANKLTSA